MPARPAALASPFALFCTADTANSTKEPHAEAPCQEFRSGPLDTALVPDQAKADNWPLNKLLRPQVRHPEHTVLLHPFTVPS